MGTLHFEKNTMLRFRMVDQALVSTKYLTSFPNAKFQVITTLYPPGANYELQGKIDLVKQDINGKRQKRKQPLFRPFTHTNMATAITNVYTDLVVNFAKNLKGKLAEELREKVKINITPSIENGQITLAVSCFNTEHPDFAESMLRLSFYSLSDEGSVPIMLATRFEKTKILSNHAQLDSELKRLLGDGIYLKILETVATRVTVEPI